MTTQPRRDGSWGERLEKLPTQAWVAAGLVILAILALVSYQPPADPDLFARVAVGRLIEVSGGVVHQDPFAFTPKLERWVDHEWLAGVVLWSVARRGGDVALFAFDIAMMVATISLVVRAQSERRGASTGWSVLTLVYLFGVWVSVVRSRVFTFLFVGLLLLALVRWRAGRSATLWLLPPAFVFWANAHGGFVAGLGLLGAATVAASLTAWAAPARDDGTEHPPVRILWIVLGLGFVGTLLNPYGLEYWTYILDATTMERTGITEWQPLRPWQIGYAGVVLGTFLLGSALQRREDRAPREAWAMVLVSVWAALGSQRLLNFLLVVLAVYGVGAYGELVRRAGRRLPPSYRTAAARSAGVGAVVTAVVLLALSVTHLSDFARTGLNYGRFPVDAIRWLETRGPGGRVLTHFNHGSYALWRLYPRYRIAIDGRYEETYPQETVDLAWLALQPGEPGHAEALAEVEPDFIVVPGPGWARDFDDSWEIVFEDGVSAVLGRPGYRTVPERPARPMWQPGY